MLRARSHLKRKTFYNGEDDFCLNYQQNKHKHVEMMSHCNSSLVCFSLIKLPGLKPVQELRENEVSIYCSVQRMR